MKVQAIKNDPSRELQDLADVQALLRLLAGLRPPTWQELRRRRGPRGEEPFRRYL